MISNTPIGIRIGYDTMSLPEAKIYLFLVKNTYLKQLNVRFYIQRNTAECCVYFFATSYNLGWLKIR